MSTKLKSKTDPADSLYVLLEMLEHFKFPIQVVYPTSYRERMGFCYKYKAYLR
jgi:hypothetical protein